MLTAILILLLAPFQLERRAARARHLQVSVYARSLYKVELLLSQQTVPMDIAAIIINSVVGEGG